MCSLWAEKTKIYKERKKKRRRIRCNGRNRYSFWLTVQYIRLEMASMWTARRCTWYNGISQDFFLAQRSPDKMYFIALCKKKGHINCVYMVHSHLCMHYIQYIMYILKVILPSVSTACRWILPYNVRCIASDNALRPQMDISGLPFQ